MLDFDRLPPPAPGKVRVIRVEKVTNNSLGVAGMLELRDLVFERVWPSLPNPFEEGCHIDYRGTHVCAAFEETFEQWFPITPIELHAALWADGGRVVALDVAADFVGSKQAVFRRHKAELVAVLM